MESKDKIIQILSNDILNERAGKNVNDFVGKSGGSNTESKDVTKNKFVNAETASDVNTTGKSFGKIYDENKRETKTIAIIGDSILKDIDQLKVRKGLASNEKLYVKYYSGATVTDMESYVIPKKSFENDLIILHCGTNDLRSIKKPNDIVDEIIKLVFDMKTEKKELMISGIVPRRDHFNSKGKEVNNCLIS